MFSGTCENSGGSAQLYRETYRKRPKSRDFSYCGERPSRTYVNMVKTAFQIGENRCLVTHPEALTG